MNKETGTYLEQLQLDEKRKELKQRVETITF